MGTKISRERLLQSLESVTPGIASREVIQQSTCFAIRDGLVYAFNDEVFCSAKTQLPKDWQCAVPSDKMLSLLRELSDEELDVELTKSELVFRAKRKKSWIAIESEIHLPIDHLELPKKWTPLHDHFTDAVKLAAECYGTDESKPELTQIHIHPKWVESCDNRQLVRYRIKTGFAESVMVKGDSLKQVPSLDVSEFGYNSVWVHFKNESGLTFSCKRWAATYRDLTSILKVGEGHKITLPNGIAQAVKTANIFSADNPDSNKVMISLQGKRLTVQGKGVTGGYEEFKNVKYDGPPMSFLIAPALLIALVARHSECELTEKRLKVEGDRFIYIAVLNAAQDTKPIEEKPEKRLVKKKREEEE